MADLRSFWPAGGASGEFLRSNTKNFLRKLSGKPRTSTNRSRSADPPKSVKSALYAEHLTELRLEIEEKTASLNDASFEVTEAWLFAFASQHAEYMEKATARAAGRHEFRSTTDLFQHVLQHPSVLKLIGTLQASESPAKSSPAKAAGIPNITNAFGISPCSEEILAHAAGKLEEGACGRSEKVAMVDTSASNSLVAASVGVKEQPTSENLDSPTGAAAPFAIPIPSVEDCNAGNRFVISKAAPVLRQRTSWPQPPVTTSIPDDVPESSSADHGKNTRSASQAAPVLRRHRASLPAAAPLTDEGGELMQKLRQRANRNSWQNISPSKSRPSTSNISNNTSEAPAASGIAARRKMLESKLATCGFQKAALAGGA